MAAEVSFIQVGDLATGFELESNLLPQTTQLTHKTLTLYFMDKPSLILTFDSETKLTFESYDDIDYRATTLREGIVFVDFLNPQSARETITIILDFIADNVTVIYGQLPTEADVRVAAFTRIEQKLNLTDVAVDIHFGCLVPFSKTHHCHSYTDELIGYRNQYIYSATERYEHIYLNENFYAWHCLDGVEKGLADVDKCHYIKIDSDLYLFIWQEKIVPTLGIILIDMKGLRTDGKIVGYKEADFKALSNFQVGSYAKVINSKN